ncbi:hypothetical protein PVAG01_03812 [Phlyctema vagabunda]|uniref:Uncharacterized protein n=1 Tax=Phlyctema vagabunda TaxID=108571 RepID=A0ABR4PMH1_9HELO
MKPQCSTQNQMDDTTTGKKTAAKIEEVHKHDHKYEHEHKHEHEHKYYRFPDIHTPKEQKPVSISANPIFAHGACPYVLSPGFLDRVLTLPPELRENIYEQIIGNSSRTSFQRTLLERNSPNGCHVGLARRNPPFVAKEELAALRKTRISDGRIFLVYKDGLFNYLSAESIHSMSVVSKILQETAKTDSKAKKMFEHFRAYIGKNTGSLYWLKNHEFYHADIQHITLNRIPAQDGVFMHQWEFVWLCIYIKHTFKHLKSVVFWLTMTDLEVLDAVESSINAKWIMAVRDLPVKESFELKMRIVREGRGCKHILSPECDAQDFESIERLVTPLSLRKMEL